MGAAVSVQDFMKQGDETMKSLIEKNQNSSNIPIPPIEDDDDDDGGLLFVDPEQERKKALEREKLIKKKEVPMIKLKDGSMIPSSFVAPTAASGSNTAAAANAMRKNYLESLKQQRMQKRSQNITLDKIKETYQTSDFKDEVDPAAEKKKMIQEYLDKKKAETEKEAANVDEQ